MPDYNRTRKGPMLFSPLRGYEPRLRISPNDIRSVGLSDSSAPDAKKLHELRLLHSLETLEAPLSLNPFQTEIKNPSMDMELFGLTVGDLHFLTSGHRLHINQSLNGKQHDQAVFIPDIFNDKNRPHVISIGGRDGGMLMGCMGIMILGRDRTSGKVDFIGTHSSRYSDNYAEYNRYHPIFYLREFVATHDEVKVYCATSFVFGSLMSGVLKEYKPEEARAILSDKINYEIARENIFDSSGFVFFPGLGLMLKGSYDQALSLLEKSLELVADSDDDTMRLGA